jgi:hypothetical protein
VKYLTQCDILQVLARALLKRPESIKKRKTLVVVVWNIQPDSGQVLSDVVYKLVNRVKLGYNVIKGTEYLVSL